MLFGFKADFGVKPLSRFFICGLELHIKRVNKHIPR
jgi:hypothetical protein